MNGGIFQTPSRIINYLTKQLGLPPSLNLEVSEREATYLEHRKNILIYLGYQKFDDTAQSQLESWIQHKANAGALPEELFGQAELSNSEATVKPLMMKP